MWLALKRASAFLRQPPPPLHPPTRTTTPTSKFLLRGYHLPSGLLINARPPCCFAAELLVHCNSDWQNPNLNLAPDRTDARCQADRTPGAWRQRQGLELGLQRTAGAELACDAAKPARVAGSRQGQGHALM